MFVGVEGGACGMSMLLAGLDPLKCWVEVSPPTLGIVGVERPTSKVENEIPMRPCIKGGPVIFCVEVEEEPPATLSTEEGPAPFQVGRYGRNLVSVLSKLQQVYLNSHCLGNLGRIFLGKFYNMLITKPVICSFDVTINIEVIKRVKIRVNKRLVILIVKGLKKRRR